MSRMDTLAALSAILLATGIAPAMRAQSAAKHPACSLLSPSEIRKLAGRSDIATGRDEPEESGTHSNCIRSGAFDLGITIDGETKVMFGRMRDTYAKAPPRMGYKIERVSGIGDDAYFLITKDRVQLKTIVGEKELTVALGEVNPGSKIPPEAQAKAIATSLAKAGVAKLH